jgi:hypothetical protein
MSLVFCRGCGAKIHETAPTCPHCGMEQAAPPKRRDVGKLICWGIVWSIVFWVIGLALVGVIAASLDPNNAQAAENAGGAYSGIASLIAICISAALTYSGMLPGTKKT